MGWVVADSGGVNGMDEGPAIKSDLGGWAVVKGWEGDRPQVDGGMGVWTAVKGVGPIEMGIEPIGICGLGWGGIRRA